MKKFIPLTMRVAGLAISIILTCRQEWIAIALILYFLLEIVVQCLKLYMHFQQVKMVENISRLGGDAADFKNFMNEFVNEVEANKMFAENKVEEKK